MVDPDDLIAACRAAPDDDAPRLVWADAIGGDRGELVTVQCDLARHERAPYLSIPEVVARRRRERELAFGLPKHERYIRGFVGRAAMRWNELIDEARWPEYVERYPLIEQLSVIPDETYKPEQYATILAQPWLAALRTFDVVNLPLSIVRPPRQMWRAAEETIFGLGEIPRSPRLDGLFLAAHARDNSGVRAIPFDRLASAKLRRFGVTGFSMYAEDYQRIAALPPLDKLAVLGPSAHPSGLETLLFAHPVRSLSIDHLGAAQLRAIPKTVEHLTVRLRGVDDLAPLADLPKLRTLSIRSAVDPDAIVNLARAIGPRLEYLTIAQEPPSELAGLVAGELGHPRT